MMWFSPAASCYAYYVRFPVLSFTVLEQNHDTFRSLRITRSSCFLCPNFVFEKADSNVESAARLLVYVRRYYQQQNRVENDFEDDDG